MSPRKTLDQLLSELPRSVEPPGTLWPQIEARLATPRRSRAVLWFPGLAAAVLVSLGLWLWHDTGHAPVQTAGTQSTPASDVRAVSFGLPDNPAYRQARAQLEQTFRERLKLLKPETRATIEENLKIIQTATDNIQRALAADPASPMLLQMLQDTQQREVDLYTDVSRNTEPELGRSSL